MIRLSNGCDTMATGAHVEPTSEPAGPRPAWPVRRFSVEEYHRMGEAGILDEDDNVELLEGWIVPKPGKSPPHAVVLGLMTEALRSHSSGEWYVRNQGPLTTEDSEPEPDLVVTLGSIRDYMARHPGPEDVALVVEVADSSLARDRRKASIYGRAGVVCYWIVNLEGETVEVYTGPNEDGFAERKEYGRGESLPLVVEGAEVARIEVADVLP